MRKDPAAVALGRKGGKVKSKRKSAAARANGKKGGRPKRVITVRMKLVPDGNPFNLNDITAADDEPLGSGAVNLEPLSIEGFFDDGETTVEFGPGDYTIGADKSTIVFTESGMAKIPGWVKAKLIK